jgi:hypothetical protein
MSIISLERRFQAHAGALGLILAFFALMIATFFIGLSPAHAAELSTLQTALSGSGTLVMEPGEVRSVSVELQNTGTETWRNDGWGYISIYTYGPKYRSSDFDAGTWEWGDHPGRISDATVAPGDTTRIQFDLKAPAALGSYEEVFHVASESIAWIDGGEVTFKINVVEAPTEVAETVSTVLEAELTAISATKMKMLAGRSALIQAGFTNTGSTTWTNYGLVDASIALASVGSSSFAHPSWDGAELAYAAQSVAPGEMALVNFSLTAPKSNGNHTAQFQFQANGEDVEGVFVELPVEVTGGAAEIINEEQVEDVDQDFVDEPMMRIGFLIVDEETDWEVVIMSDESDFNLIDVNGNLLAELALGEQVTAYYDGGHYYYDLGRGLEVSTAALRFEPTQENTVMRVANFDRTVTRSHRHVDNEFRGILELRYNDYKERTWLINELPLEFYLRGLAETSDVSPMEYQKSLITAARTYAYYHYTRGTKYEREYFHISSYSWDQVYNGYGQETRAPKITKAVEATRGMIVTYGEEIAITPYFSRSDGYTRDWATVWGGDVAWAKSVKVPCDEGRTLWGHGVGMSASGALCMANAGDDWETILKHFYTGIDLTQKWD